MFLYVLTHKEAALDSLLQEADDRLPEIGDPFLEYLHIADKGEGISHHLNKVDDPLVSLKDVLDRLVGTSKWYEVGNKKSPTLNKIEDKFQTTARSGWIWATQ